MVIAHVSVHFLSDIEESDAGSHHKDADDYKTLHLPGVQEVDDAVAYGFRIADGILLFAEEFSMLGIGEECGFGDGCGNERLVAGVQPVAAAPAAIVADDDPAAHPIVGHAPFVVYIIGDDICQGQSQPRAFLIAVDGALVVDHPFGGHAVVVQVDHSGGVLVERIVGAEHAHSHAVWVVLGAVNGSWLGCVHVVYLLAGCDFGELLIRGYGTAAADEAFVARLADDSRGVSCVAVPELAFLDVTVALIRGACTLSAAFGVVVVADIEHHDF